MLTILWAGISTVQAQAIDVDIRNRKVVSATQFTFEIWMRAGTGYVPQTAPFNNPNNLESNGGWTGMTQRYDFNFADARATTIASTSSARDGNLSSSGSSVSQAPLPGYDAAIGVTFGRSSANTQPDLTLVYTLYTTITVNVNVATGGSVDWLDQNVPRFANPSAGTSKWSNGASPSTNRSFSATNSIFSLPLNLVDFKALKSADEARVQLNWKTAYEQNTASFDVERSTDGKAFNEVVAKVKAAGNSTTEQLYQAYDNSPVKGTNYYRLKIADLSGKTAYSEIRTVRFDGKATNVASFYPNPLNSDNVANAHLKIIASADQRLAYIISDAGGRMVHNGSIAVVTGTETYKVDGLNELAAGAYFITLNGTTIKATLKLNKTQ